MNVLSTSRSNGWPWCLELVKKKQCIPQTGPSLFLNTMSCNPRPPNSSTSTGTHYSARSMDNINPALRALASSPICGPLGLTASVHPGPMSKATGIVLEISQLKQRVAQLEGEKEDMMGQLNRIKTNAWNEKTRLNDVIVDMKREMAEISEELNGCFDETIAKGRHDGGKVSDDEDDELSEYDSDGLPMHDQEMRLKVEKSKEACKQNLIKVCLQSESKLSLPKSSLLFVMSLLKPWAVLQLGSLPEMSSLTSQDQTKTFQTQLSFMDAWLIPLLIF